MISSDYDVISSCRKSSFKFQWTIVFSLDYSVADSSGFLVRRILWFHWTMML